MVDGRWVDQGMVPDFRLAIPYRVIGDIEAV